MQTPQDDEMFYSFAVSETQAPNDEAAFTSFLFSGDNSMRNILQFHKWRELPARWRASRLAMIVVPLLFLDHHVRFLTEKLADLIQRVELIERNVSATQSTKLDFNDLIHELHACNRDLITLERRWRFQNQLDYSIREFIGRYKQSSNRTQDVKFFSCNFSGDGHTNIHIDSSNAEDKIAPEALQNDKDFKRLDSDSVMQSRLSESCEYDLSVLPRRITNQFTAVRLSLPHIISSITD